jgi:hypothetical protein
MKRILFFATFILLSTTIFSQERLGISGLWMSTSGNIFQLEEKEAGFNYKNISQNEIWQAGFLNSDIYGNLVFLANFNNVYNIIEFSMYYTIISDKEIVVYDTRTPNKTFTWSKLDIGTISVDEESKDDNPW